MSDAVLLLAYGAPESLDDLPAYLADIRGGRPTPPQLIAEVTRRYRLIGSKSPLLAITRRVAVRLQERLLLPVYVGMRHWHPYIADTVREMIRDGVTRATVICLAPHYSALSIGAYRAKLDAALRDSELQIDFVEAWHTQPQYINGIAQNIRATLAQFESDAKIIFTAHTLPIAARVPYEMQLRETAQLVARNLGWRDNRWMLAYQSQPRAGGEWLGPQIETLVPQLARAGERNLVVAPIGFVADHVEVLYDIDIALQEIARANNVRLARTPMLNDSDAIVQTLAELVKERNAQYAMREMES
jgi:ferrochelatase